MSASSLSGYAGGAQLGTPSDLGLLEEVLIAYLEYDKQFNIQQLRIRQHNETLARRVCGAFQSTAGAAPHPAQVTLGRGSVLLEYQPPPRLTDRLRGLFGRPSWRAVDQSVSASDVGGRVSGQSAPTSNKGTAGKLVARRRWVRAISGAVSAHQNVNTGTSSGRKTLSSSCCEEARPQGGTAAADRSAADLVSAAEAGADAGADASPVNGGHSVIDIEISERNSNQHEPRLPKVSPGPEPYTGGDLQPISNTAGAGDASASLRVLSAGTLASTTLHPSDRRGLWRHLPNLFAASATDGKTEVNPRASGPPLTPIAAASNHGLTGRLELAHQATEPDPFAPDDHVSYITPSGPTMGASNLGPGGGVGSSIGRSRLCPVAPLRPRFWVCYDEASQSDLLRQMKLWQRRGLALAARPSRAMLRVLERRLIKLASHLESGGVVSEAVQLELWRSSRLGLYVLRSETVLDQALELAFWEPQRADQPSTSLMAQLDDLLGWQFWLDLAVDFPLLATKYLAQLRLVDCTDRLSAAIAEADGRLPPDLQAQKQAPGEAPAAAAAAAAEKTPQPKAQPPLASPLAGVYLSVGRGGGDVAGARSTAAMSSNGGHPGTAGMSDLGSVELGRNTWTSAQPQQCSLSGAAPMTPPPEGAPLATEEQQQQQLLRRHVDCTDHQVVKRRYLAAADDDDPKLLAAFEAAQRRARCYRVPIRGIASRDARMFLPNLLGGDPHRSFFSRPVIQAVIGFKWGLHARWIYFCFAFHISFTLGFIVFFNYFFNTIYCNLYGCNENPFVPLESEPQAPNAPPSPTSMPSSPSVASAAAFPPPAGSDDDKRRCAPDAFWPLMVTYLVVPTLFFMVYELCQFMDSVRQSWWQEWLNLLDVLSMANVITIAVIVASDGCDINFHLMRALCAVEVLILFIQTLYFAMPYSRLGGFVAMLHEVVVDLWPFFSVIMLLILGFVLASFCLLPGSTFLANLINAYQLLYGTTQFGSNLIHGASQETLYALLVLIYQVLAAIVMLNVLIAVVSETYLRVRANEGWYLDFNKARMVNDTESLVTRITKPDTELYRQYVYVLEELSLFNGDPEEEEAAERSKEKQLLHEMKREMEQLKVMLGGLERQNADLLAQQLQQQKFLQEQLQQQAQMLAARCDQMLSQQG